jgi:5-methylthioadenosine/S-adenosylhomocysteine deaminase
MLAEGVGVCLGTDGCSSNNSLDMFLEMKFASLMHKAHKWDATVLNAQKVLDMATLDAAKAIGAEKELGSIEVGKKADLIIVDAKSAAMAPTRPDNVIANIVYAGPSQAVRDTMVDGKFVLRDRKIMNLDEAGLIMAAEQAAQELVDRSR